MNSLICNKVSIPNEVIGFFNWPNPSGHARPLTEVNTRIFPRSKGQKARKADNLTAICEPNVLEMCEP
jgi:hypothetical protein